MKKRLLLFLMFLLCFISKNVYADSMIIEYNGKTHEYTGSVYSLKVDGEFITTPMPPIIFNDSALVPVREILESMGAVVEYYPLSKQVFISHNNNFMRLKINNNEVDFNDETLYVPGDITPMLISLEGGEAKTMIPVRFVAETFGFDVEFDGENGIINILTPTETNKITIYDYKCKKTNSDTTTLEIKLDAPVDTISKPAVTAANVLYLDVENAKYSISNSIDINIGAIKRLRVGLHDNYTRVAIDLDDFKTYKVVLADNKKTILITVTSNKTDNDNENVNNSQNNTNNNDNNDNTNINNGEKIVVIDAGHGGSDPGACVTVDDTLYDEKSINLRVALKIRDILENNNIKVMMTRDDDTFLSLPERSDFANINNAVFFVSIHSNSATTKTADGYEIYYSKQNNTDFTGLTSNELAKSISNSLSKNVSTRNRGVKSADHVVTKLSIMPAVLVEIGFMTNPEEFELMQSDEYTDDFAKGVAEGIIAVFDDVNKAW